VSQLTRQELRERALQWQNALSLRLQRPVVLTWSRARKTPLSMRGRKDGVLELRLHSMFAGADEAMREAVARWITAGKRATRACQALDAFVEVQLAATRPPAPVLQTRGAVYDLLDIADEVRREYFATQACPPLGWGRATSNARRGLRLGSYDPDSRSVRIHPVLDQVAVPRFVVAFVVFHEFLHHRYPPKRAADGRLIHHGPEFRAAELAHPRYAEVIAFERAHLRALVASARTGKPMSRLSLIVSRVLGRS
jgi:hypothetical protein